MDLPEPLTLDEAETWQSRLAARVELRPAFRDLSQVHTVGVLAVDPAARRGRVGAAGAVLRLPSGDVVERARVARPARSLFPDVPALNGFRWVPVLRAVLDKWAVAPDVLMVEGAGIAHRRGLGVASHLGVVTDRPTFGVARACDYGRWEDPPPGLAGAHVFIYDGGAPIGLVVRAQAYRAPLFLSPGHRVGLMPALDVLWAVLGGRRVPDPFWAVRPPRRVKTTRRGRRS